MKIKDFFKNKTVKNFLSALAVVVFGFVLLNLAFIADALLQNSIDAIFRLFFQVDFNMAWRWFPPVKHVMFMVVISIVSWFVLQSKLRVLFKAIYLTVPVAVILVTLGITFYPWPGVPFWLGALFSGGALYYCYHTKKSWLYSYSIILVSLTLLLFTLVGGEI